MTQKLKLFWQDKLFQIIEFELLTGVGFHVKEKILLPGNNRMKMYLLNKCCG